METDKISREGPRLPTHKDIYVVRLKPQRVNLQESDEPTKNEIRSFSQEESEDVINRLKRNFHPQETKTEQQKPKPKDPFRWGVYSAFRKYLLKELF